MEENELEQIEGLIKEKEEAFQRALTNNAESSLLTYMKKDIDLFRDKRAELFRKLKKEKEN
jgi:hypothetical protein